MAPYAHVALPIPQPQATQVWLALLETLLVVPAQRTNVADKTRYCRFASTATCAHRDAMQTWLGQHTA